MKSGKGLFWIRIISCLISLASLIAGSFLLQHSSFVVKTAELNIFQNECKKAKADYCFANVCISESEKNNIHEQIFLNTYSDNFSKTSTRILSVSDDNGVASFSTTFNGMQIPFETSVVSGINYSNNRDLVRFETVCINLLLFRERQVEHNYNRELYDGFIYIPDYYADYLLENNSGIGSTYMDLLESDTNVIALSKGDRSFRYKIANIFHVSGFQEKFTDGIDISYNDYDTGYKLNTFFNDFCFVSNYSRFSELDEGLFTSVVFEAEPKKYELDEFLNLAGNYKTFHKANKGSAHIYFYSSNGLKKCSNSNQLSDAYFYRTNASWHVFIGIVTFMLSLIIAFLSYFELFGLKRDVLMYFLLFFVHITFLIASFVLKKCFPFNTGLYLFFNPFSALACIVTVLTLIIIICSIKFRKRGKGHEC